MSHRKPKRKKRRTREHIIADLSINHTQGQALLAGYATSRDQILAQLGGLTHHD